MNLNGCCVTTSSASDGNPEVAQRQENRMANRATDLLGAGFAPAQAQAIGGGTPATALSAAGTTLATATDLTSAINLVSTAAASSGVALPLNSNVGDQITVFNDGTGNSFY